MLFDLHFSEEAQHVQASNLSRCRYHSIGCGGISQASTHTRRQRRGSNWSHWITTSSRTFTATTTMTTATAGRLVHVVVRGPCSMMLAKGMRAGFCSFMLFLLLLCQSHPICCRVTGFKAKRERHNPTQRHRQD